ncbi:LytTR family DNA-binding domain-containing protein [Aurantiacibacter aquimixticola]|uniref:LytTR family transcriptional regulator n=1 Tax=Aurantiacibacter aquimixticola TaxID=1958945 RepID=A0A419RTY3_9SPHN|nr:LytTR family DNA-binding domain-containing protein [Aurantiacibacter aquimixticola]RJY09253.1 LytTR family transcriptional regulator [Aurantiacibacter aquimixticola]
MSELTLSTRAAVTRRLLIDLAVMTAIGVVLALIGPFGSFQDPLPVRLLWWVSLAWVGYALYSPIDWLAKRLAPVLALPAWALRVVGVLVSSAPMAVLVWMLPRDAWHWPGLDLALTHYAYVAIIGGLITLVNTLVQRSSANTVQPPPAATEPEPQSAPQPRFLERLPAHLGSDLMALEMEDHYVRAHTALGSELVLMRMRDAVAELDGIEGEQVHRSWWVARGAVGDVQRDGRNVRLILENGLEAPVSRANVAALKERGWI